MANGKTQYTNIFTLKQLFSIPLQAVVEANMFAAKSAIKLIEEYGFEKTDKGKYNFGKLRMVSFAYEYMENGHRKTMTVKIPLLSLIPIPFLEIKNATFDFGIKILSLEETVQLQGGNPSDDEDDPPGKEIVYAMIVPPGNKTEVVQQQYSITANLDAHIEMGKADIPAGILQLINLGQQAIQGEQANTFIMKVPEGKFLFTPQNPAVELAVAIERLTGEGDVAEKSIKIELASNNTPLLDMFDQPIQVEAGDVVGTPTPTTAKILTGPDGLIKVVLTAKADAKNGNGFVRISAKEMDDKLIYYSVTQNS